VKKSKKLNVSLKLGTSLPKPARIGLIAAGALLLLLMGWLILLSPKQKRIADLKAETARVQQQIAQDLTRAAEARNATAAPTIRVADVYKLQTAMPTIVDMPDLLLELDQTAGAAGVTIDSLQPQEPTPTGSYSALHVSVSAHGNFYSITDLLYRLRNLVYVRNGALQSNGRIFSVDSVSLAPGNSTISATIALTTYVYGSVASAALGAVASPPAATTTSTTDTTTTDGSSSTSGPSASGATP
jgi:Tfp pilus assembly protein PilO